ncbi:alpha/beta hydrolase [Pseudonocardia humida]|uniref:Alpha/beta hydrolase n=1 Tax=Pseudonocardia humida TaxID=2800819 RepID=A0ABT1A5N0_9PSEU|nr:alpha/beta hydrolase [Pseudonocardia humida]MCO1658318.1 alpha/beta hydrolase [Pseudonocardia humida]
MLIAGALAAAATASLTGSALGGPVPGGVDPSSRAPAEAGDVRQVELTVPTADGLALPATLRIPADPRPGAPAVVMVHGAGAGPRDKYREEAEAFAAAGVATLAYDKRSVGYSLTERSYSQLADDAVAAAGVLREQPGIDPGAVGLWGTSEGGWVAPLAASRDERTAFLVVIGANGLEPLRQQTWAEALKVHAAGVRGSLVDAASSGVYRLISDMGMFPEPYYDPAPVLSGLTLPVLGVWGALDRATPPVESVAAFRTALERAGNPHYTLRTIDGADHGLHTTTDGFSEGPVLAPGYVDLVASWTSAAASGAAPRTSVSGTGDQPLATAAVPPLGWWESAPAHGVALGLMLGGFGGFALTAAVRRLHRVLRPGPAMPAPVAARVVAGAGLVTVVGTLYYLVELTLVRGGRTIDPGPLLLERTLPWLALQVLAVTTVVAAVVLVVGLLRGRGSRPAALDPAEAPEPVGAGRGGRGPGTVRRPAGPARSAGERIRITALLVAAAAFVPWALYWGLLVP